MTKRSMPREDANGSDYRREIGVTDSGRRPDFGEERPFLFPSEVAPREENRGTGAKPS